MAVALVQPFTNVGYGNLSNTATARSPTASGNFIEVTVSATSVVGSSPYLTVTAPGLTFHPAGSSAAGGQVVIEKYYMAGIKHVPGDDHDYANYQ